MNIIHAFSYLLLFVAFSHAALAQRNSFTYIVTERDTSTEQLARRYRTPVSYIERPDGTLPAQISHGDTLFIHKTGIFHLFYANSNPDPRAFIETRYDMPVRELIGLNSIQRDTVYPDDVLLVPHYKALNPYIPKYVKKGLGSNDVDIFLIKKDTISVVHYYNEELNHNRLLVYRGGELLQMFPPVKGRGSAMHRVGHRDINNDGYLDIEISHPNLTPWASVYLYAPSKRAFFALKGAHDFLISIAGYPDYLYDRHSSNCGDWYRTLYKIENESLVRLAHLQLHICADQYPYIMYTDFIDPRRNEVVKRFKDQSLYRGIPKESGFRVDYWLNRMHYFTNP